MKSTGLVRFASAPMTALNRSSKSPRKRVPASRAVESSAKTSAPLSGAGTSRLQQAQREALGHRRLAHAGLAHEHRIVLAAAAEDLDRPLQFLGAPDQRIELAGCGALAQVDRVRGERVSCRAALLVVIALLAGMAQLARLVLVRHGHLADAVRDVVEHVEAGDALRGEQLGRVGLLLLEHRGEHVPGPHFIASGALHVQDGRLQHAPEGERLLGLAVAAAAELLERFREVRVEVDAELPQIHADRGQDRSPSASCASAYSRCSSVRCVCRREPASRWAIVRMTSRVGLNIRELTLWALGYRLRQSSRVAGAFIR